MSAPRIVVVGSINLDLVARAATLPAPGETVTRATFAQYPGGKGANQALAAQRLGAAVTMIGRVGRDAHAEAALALLTAGGVDLSLVSVDDNAATGVALIAVAETGENQIVVASGANDTLRPSHVTAPPHDAMILQLEIPGATVADAALKCTSFLAVNLAPALPAPPVLFERADLIVVNEIEAETYAGALHAARGLVAITYGATGAALFREGRELARAEPPSIAPVDSTGAGDGFVAALTIALLEARPKSEALRFACAAGAAACLKPGAQTALPTRDEVEALLQT